MNTEVNMWTVLLQKHKDRMIAERGKRWADIVLFTTNVKMLNEAMHADGATDKMREMVMGVVGPFINATLRHEFPETFEMEGNRLLEEVSAILEGILKVTVDPEVALNESGGSLEKRSLQ